MLPARVVRITDPPISIAVIDSVLAPDLPLAHMNTFIGSQVMLILRIHESRNQALRPIAIPHHLRNHLQRLMNRLPCLFARVIHRGEVASRYKRDLVAVLVVIQRQQPPRLLVLLPVVLQSQPADRPCHPAIWSPLRKCFSPRPNMLRAVQRSLILSDIVRARHLDLIHAHHRDMRHEQSPQRRRDRAPRQPVIARPGRKRASRLQEPSPGPVISHCLPFHLPQRVPRLCFAQTLCQQESYEKDRL